MTNGGGAKCDPTFRLDGRTAFVTGAGGHLGRAMAKALARAGASVILNGRTAVKLEAIRDELAGGGYAASIAAFDVCDRAAAAKAFNSLGRLDVMVNNAITGLAERTASSEKDAFDAPIRSGLVATHDNIWAAMPALEAAVAATGHASVINIASIFGHISPMFSVYAGEVAPSPAQYAAAKGGLLQMTRYLACQLAPRGVRVNSLTPGIFPWVDIEAALPGFAARAKARTPMERFGEAHEIGGPLVFLASDAATFVTGADLKVDGGWTAW